MTGVLMEGLWIFYQNFCESLYRHCSPEYRRGGMPQVVNEGAVLCLNCLLLLTVYTIFLN